ncbi:MAG: hypothetical protein DRI90_14425 [Deltaproteobacteria bacterium]|nr:MAG: hypothetical protein DRI90_14425 [Deltaproteobacteria bacterium]
MQPGQNHHLASTGQPLPPAQRPGWLKWVLVFMGVCTPGGFLFLIALLTTSNIDLDGPVWFILAALGGVAGWFLAKRAG